MNHNIYFYTFGQRDIATNEPSSTTNDPQYPNRLIQLAINRTAKTTNGVTEISPLSLDVALNQKQQPPQQSTLSVAEIAKGEQDIAQVNSDLQLLSTLLGRPITADDLPNLANGFGANDRPLPTPPPAVRLTTIAATANHQPAIIKEVELLQSLLEANKQNEDSSVAVPVDAYGKTNDALLATLLKQQGIGPAHNNVPVQQLISANLYPTSSETAPVLRPRPLATQRPGRPVLDGLSWLWRTWQETSPGQQNINSSGRTKTRASPQLAPQPAYSPTTNGAVNFDDGLDSDTAAVSTKSIIKQYLLISIVFDTCFVSSTATTDAQQRNRQWLW